MGESDLRYSCALESVGENGELATTRMSGGSDVSSASSNIVEGRRSGGWDEVEATSRETDPARSRLRDGAVASAAATRGRLIELSLLPNRIASTPLDSEPRMFSALRLLFSVLGLPAALSETANSVLLPLACIARVEVAVDETLSNAGLRKESALLTLMASLSEFWCFGFVLRNWTHQSPERHRRTRRFVVGLTSRMFSFSISDSRTCTIWARL